MASDLTSIPENVLHMTLSYLPLVNQISVTRVSGTWRQVIEDRIWPERKILDDQDIQRQIYSQKGSNVVEKHIKENYLPRFKNLKKFRVSWDMVDPKILAQNNPKIKIFTAFADIDNAIEYRDTLRRFSINMEEDEYKRKIQELVKSKQYDYYLDRSKDQSRLDFPPRIPSFDSGGKGIHFHHTQDEEKEYGEKFPGIYIYHVGKTRLKLDDRYRFEELQKYPLLSHLTISGTNFYNSLQYKRDETIQKLTTFLRERGNQLIELIFESKNIELGLARSAYDIKWTENGKIENWNLKPQPKEPTFDPTPIIIDAIRISGCTPKLSSFKIFYCMIYDEKRLTINYRDTFAQLEQLPIIIPLLDKWRKITINTLNNYNYPASVTNDVQDLDQWNLMVNNLIDNHRHKAIIVKNVKDRDQQIEDLKKEMIEKRIEKLPDELIEQFLSHQDYIKWAFRSR